VHERQPLSDAEPVLLIDDDEAELRECQPLPEKRVGTDGHGEIAPSDGRLPTLALPSRDACRDQRHAGACSARQRSHGIHVLLREDARRCQDRHLSAGGDALRGCRERDRRLPRPHVPEEQAPHRCRRSEVLSDGCDRLVLAAGEREPQLGAQASERGAVDGE
jgi:hypothetical protein